MDHLAFTVLEKVDSEDKARVIAQVCSSHDIILTAGKMVQSSDRWKDDEKIQKQAKISAHLDEGVA